MIHGEEFFMDPAPEILCKKEEVPGIVSGRKISILNTKYVTQGEIVPVSSCVFMYLRGL